MAIYGETIYYNMSRVKPVYIYTAVSAAELQSERQSCRWPALRRDGVYRWQRLSDASSTFHWFIGALPPIYCGGSAVTERGVGRREDKGHHSGVYVEAIIFSSVGESCNNWPADIWCGIDHYILSVHLLTMEDASSLPEWDGGLNIGSAAEMLAQHSDRSGPVASSLFDFLYFMTNEMTREHLPFLNAKCRRLTHSRTHMYARHGNWEAQGAARHTNTRDQCWFNAGRASATLAQHWINIGSQFRTQAGKSAWVGNTNQTPKSAATVTAARRQYRQSSCLGHTNTRWRDKIGSMWGQPQCVGPALGQLGNHTSHH